MPTLQYGPGDVRLAHSPRESVDLGGFVVVTRVPCVLAVRRPPDPLDRAETVRIPGGVPPGARTA
ncbi:hypothetical protein ADJ73_05840 [Arsenicicoccus sp. oral taxon 190]|nr:hypothetical protein ADJ73_05840 [Arsenicicoccus sp. oral taxon 190]